MLCFSMKLVDVDTTTTIKASTGDDAYRVTYPDGYVSAVPIEIFKTNYLPVPKNDALFFKTLMSSCNEK